MYVRPSHGPRGHRAAYIAPLKIAMHKAQHIPALDGLRGLAIALVLWLHLLVHPLPDVAASPWLQWYQAVAGYGWAGVDLFFVLSGFLITRQLLQQKGQPGFFRSFYLRRAFRILPAYWLLLAAFAVGIYTGVPQISPWLTAGAFPWYSYLLFLQNFWIGTGQIGAIWLAPTWSLAVEEQFYLLFPLLLYLLPKRRLPWLLLAGMMLAPVVRAFWLTGYVGYVQLPGRMDALFAGALLAWVWQQGGFRYSAALVQRLRLSAWLLLALAAVLAWMRRATEGDVWLHTVLMLLAAALLAIRLLHFAGGRADRFFTWTPLRWLGHLSYSLYLWHQVANGLVHGWAGQPVPAIKTLADVGLALLALLLSLGMAAFSYWMVEQPLRRWGSTLAPLLAP